MALFSHCCCEAFRFRESLNGINGGTVCPDLGDKKCYDRRDFETILVRVVVLLVRLIFVDSSLQSLEVTAVDLVTDAGEVVLDILASHLFQNRLDVR